jgi:hypothetical protein
MQRTGTSVLQGREHVRKAGYPISPATLASAVTRGHSPVFRGSRLGGEAPGWRKHSRELAVAARQPSAAFFDIGFSFSE